MPVLDFEISLYLHIYTIKKKSVLIYLFYEAGFGVLFCCSIGVYVFDFLRWHLSYVQNTDTVFWNALYYKALVSVIQLEAKYKWNVLKIAVHLCSWVDA